MENHSRYNEHSRTEYVTPTEFRLSGVTYDDRQVLIKKLKPKEPLIIRREPENLFDRNAIAVYNNKGFKLGYIPKSRTDSIRKTKDTYACVQYVSSYNDTAGVTIYVK